MKAKTKLKLADNLLIMICFFTFAFIAGLIGDKYPGWGYISLIVGIFIAYGVSAACSVLFGIHDALKQIEIEEKYGNS